jgi:mRNA interferase MazF
MPSTTGYRQGDIVLVSFPFTDLASAKRRPAVVISPNAFHFAQEDLILAAVTSQIAPMIGSVLVGRDDVTDGMLPKDSMVRLGKIFTLHSSLVIKRLCRLTPEKKQLLMEQLQAFFSSH